MNSKNKTIESGKNILFLYAQITPYLLGCINHYINHNPNNNILLIYLDVFKNLQINSTKRCKLISKKKFKRRKEIQEYAVKFNPDLVLVSGRMDKDYLAIAKFFANKIKRVTLQDTIYEKTFRQYIQTKFTKYLYKQYFDKFWGIGMPQTNYAKRIGFKPSDISEGFYVADKTFFDRNIIFEYKNVKELNFLFIGRLAREKNIINLARAIETINNLTNSFHKLTIIGEGYELSKINKFQCVDYLGLKSQNQIVDIAKTCHVFCLPSTYEPWGVVVHEMAALGLPILISNKCGSSFDLVIDGHNGFKFDPLNIKSIKQSLNKFISLNDDEKKLFSINSNLIAKKINHFKWNNTLNSFLN
jgi:glycosyltransferase involved in cell wall biosynthesis